MFCDFNVRGVWCGEGWEEGSEVMVLRCSEDWWIFGSCLIRFWRLGGEGECGLIWVGEFGLGWCVSGGLLVVL